MDDVGLESEHIERQVRYSLCSSGGDWNIEISEITPEVIIPRLVLEGLAQVGFSVEFEWRGPGQTTDAILQTPRLIDRPLSQEDADEYDEEWVRLGRPPSLDSPTRTSAAYFLLGIRQPTRQRNETTLNLENEISDHRLNDCVIPGTGCLKIPLMLEIPYTYRDPYATVTTTDGNHAFSGTPSQNPQGSVAGVQRQCWDVELTIDRRLPADAIPKAFLESSVDVLNSAIDAIDTVLRPVNTAKKWVFIGCLGSWAAWWVKKATEWSSCVGVIPQTCIPQPNDASDRCGACLKARAETLKFWEKTQWVCDRIMCPAAPTVQKYVRDAKKNRNEVPSHCAAQDATQVEWQSKRGDETWNEYWNSENILIEPRLVDGNVPGHPDQQYCEYEYIKEYDSVAVGLNEFKESYCLTPKGKEDPKCGGLQVFPRLIRGVCTGQTNERIVIATSMPGQRDTSYWVIDADPNSGDGSIKAAWEGEYNAEFRCTEAERQTERCNIGDTIANYVRKKDSSPILRVRSGLGGAIAGGAFCARGEGDAEEFIPYEDQTPAFKRRVPLGVYEQVCAEAKEYVIDPTSDLISAFQSICLTAISEYLSHYKQILLMVKNCFNTILVTGDGSAGICKQVLSIYICDLIYFAIKCIIEKAGRGFGGSRSEVRGGFSGFLGYVSNSGANTQNKIRSRYGSTGIYRSLFLERKLVHATCRFAFTGDWDYNIEGLLEQEVQVPIATTCYITGTRRFLTKDPSKGGRASFLYHLGVFVVAGGSDRTTYTVQLVCSGDNSCNSDIDPNGNCDCLQYQGGQRVEGVRVGPGSLRQGETVNEEVFREAKLPYRYDNAKVLITYRNNQGQVIRDEECAVVNLMNIGGPPPADCGFEGGEYHCAFDFGRYGVAYFDQSVRLKDEGQPGIFLGETIELDGAIIKNSPSDIPQQTMYLKYSVYDRENTQNQYIPETIIPVTADGAIPFASGIPGGAFPGIKIVNTPTNLQNKELNPFDTASQARAIQSRGAQQANEPIVVEFSDPLAQFTGFSIVVSKASNGYLLTSSKPCFDGSASSTSKEVTESELANGVQCILTEDGQQTITLRGSLTDTENTAPLAISIQPRRQLPADSHKTLRLHISLHYASEEPGHTYDPVVIRWNGAEQQRDFDIAVHNQQPPASYQVIETATLLGCPIGALQQECACGDSRCGGGSNEYCCNSEAPYCRRGAECNTNPPQDTGITYSIESNGETKAEDTVTIHQGQPFTFRANNINDEDPGIYKVEFTLGNNVINLRQTWGAPYHNSVNYEAQINTDRLIDGSTYEIKLKITDGDGNIRDTTTPRSIQITAPATT